MSNVTAEARVLSMLVISFPRNVVWGADMDPKADSAYLQPLIHRRWRNPRLLKKISQEDMLQKILLEVHSSETGGRRPGHSSREAWLIGVAENVLNQAIRGLYCDKRDIRCEESLSVDRHVATPRAGDRLLADQTSPSQQAIRGERDDRVAEALGRLPPDEQNAAILYFYEGMTMADIGETLGRSTSTVSYWIQKALARLAADLKSLDNHTDSRGPS